jgi:signal peptidase I
MTDQPEEPKNTVDELPGVEGPALRKVRPALAFFANFLGYGLGYVYVGEIGLAVGMLAGMYGVIALFSWTRVVLMSALMWWLVAVLTILNIVISTIHPAIIAVRNRQRPAKPYDRWWVYLLWILVVNGVGFTVRERRAEIFGYEPFRVPTESMSPTIQSREFIVADTWRYRHHSPSNGEIVVLERPTEPGIKYVKRIVGVPGDRIEAKDAVLYRNGEAVTEPYLHALRPYIPYGRDFALTLVGPGQVFVLGDYRDNSLDSRAWGPIPIDHLHGRAEYIWLSLAVGVDRWKRTGILLRP